VKENDSSKVSQVQPKSYIFNQLFSDDEATCVLITVPGALLLTGFGALFLVAAYTVLVLRPVDVIITSVSH
jgi:hypothetical protein